MKQLVVQTYSPDQLTDVVWSFGGDTDTYRAMAVPLEYCKQSWKVDSYKYDLALTGSFASDAILTVGAALYRQVAPISQAGSSDVVLEPVVSRATLGFVLGPGAGGSSSNSAVINSSDNLDLIGGNYWVVFVAGYFGALDPADVARATFKGIIDTDSSIAYPKYDINFSGGITEALSSAGPIIKSELTRNTTDWPWVACIWG